MTENKALLLLSQMYLPSFCDEEKQALSKAIEVLQEIQQYRAIGTVEECKAYREACEVLRLEQLSEYRELGTVKECREAMERRKAKKVKNRKLLRDFYNIPYSVRGDCPNCGSEGLLSINTDYCNACGQKLDWSDTL